MHVAVLSPHRDDAAFSCGLLLRASLLSGILVSIVNVFTVSDYAPYLEENGCDRVEQVTAARAAEDVLFVDRLLQAARVEHNRILLVNLGWQDAPLRWRVPSEQVLRPVPLLEQETLALASSLRQHVVADIILAPLALGEHVDHRLVREAAVNAFGEGKLLFYEDLPYACRMWQADRTEVSLPSHQIWLPSETGASGSKRADANVYTSQIGPVVADEMEQYARQLGGRERFHGAPEAIAKIQDYLARQDQAA